MKYAHHIWVNVFSNPEDDENKIREALIKLFPFGLEDEKVIINSQNATGFGERKIKILEIILGKQRHTDAFLKHLMQNIGQNQANILEKQKESRLDSHLNFFLRLDKKRLLEGDYIITDKGDCYHIKISVAAFPATKEAALGVIDNMLKEAGSEKA